MGRKWDGNGKKMNDTVKFDNCSAIIRQNEFFSLETTGWVTANHQNQNNSVRFSNRSEMGADMLLWSIHLHIFLKAIKPVNMICFFFLFERVMIKAIWNCWSETDGMLPWSVRQEDEDHDTPIIKMQRLFRNYEWTDRQIWTAIQTSISSDQVRPIVMNLLMTPVMEMMEHNRIDPMTPSELHSCVEFGFDCIESVC